MISKVLSVYKPLYWTPLQVLEQLRVKFPELKDEKLSYAGRLDPMAEGVMLVLLGEENKNRDAYLLQDKTYEFTALIGVSTDSFDLLGMPVIGTQEHDRKSLKDYLGRQIGKITQAYPPYSGKTIDGVKMFELAKAGTLPTSLPTIDGELFSIDLQKNEKVTFEKILSRVKMATQQVKGDFRQTAIYQAWKALDLTAEKSFPLYTCTMRGTSGLFVRRLVDDMGKYIGSGATTYSIVRTQVGSYGLKDCISVQV